MLSSWQKSLPWTSITFFAYKWTYPYDLFWCICRTVFFGFFFFTGSWSKVYHLHFKNGCLKNTTNLPHFFGDGNWISSQSEWFLVNSWVSSNSQCSLFNRSPVNLKERNGTHRWPSPLYTWSFLLKLRLSLDCFVSSILEPTLRKNSDSWLCTHFQGQKHQWKIPQFCFTSLQVFLLRRKREGCVTLHAPTKNRCSVTPALHKPRLTDPVESNPCRGIQVKF